MQLAFDTIDEAQVQLAGLVLTEGHATSPRALPTREVCGLSFRLNAPRARRVWLRSRSWSFPLALGELAWHLRGSSDVNELAFYAPRWTAFATENRQIVGSCYGKRIGALQADGQLARCRNLLRLDPMSRRAVLSFWDPLADLALGVDVACACILQFLLRDNRVHAVAYMRSNDLILGLPYDVFLFTMLQELLAIQLGMDVGSYTHNTGSLHIYEPQLAIAERIASDLPCKESPMPPMDDHEGAATFAMIETSIRTGALPVQELPDLSPYWAALAEELIRYRNARDQDIHSRH